MIARGDYMTAKEALMIARGDHMTAKEALMIGQFFKDCSGHYVLPMGSARTSPGPIF
jgi:hypothetical protein